MKTVYVAGPMRNYPNYNFPAFFAAQEKLEAEGWKVINPAQIDIDHGFKLEDLKDNHDFANEPPETHLFDIVKRDILALIDCTAIYLLKGWENSQGATAEKAVAEWLGMKVIYE